MVHRAKKGTSSRQEYKDDRSDVDDAVEGVVDGVVNGVVGGVVRGVVDGDVGGVGGLVLYGGRRLLHKLGQVPHHAAQGGLGGVRREKG